MDTAPTTTANSTPPSSPHHDIEGLRNLILDTTTTLFPSIAREDLKLLVEKMYHLVEQRQKYCALLLHRKWSPVSRTFYNVEVAQSFPSHDTAYAALFSMADTLAGLLKPFKHYQLMAESNLVGDVVFNEEYLSQEEAAVLGA